MKNATRFLRGATASATVTNLASVALALGASVLVARALGAEGRGQFAAVFSAFTITMMVGELGQSAAVTYQVASRPTEVAEAVATGRRIMVVATSLAASAALAVALVVADPHLTVAYAIALLGCLANAFGAPYLYAAQSVAFSAWNRLRLVQPVAYLVVVVGLFALDALTVSSLAGALVLSTTLGVVASGLFGRTADMTGARPTSDLMRSMLRYGAWGASAGIPISLGQNLDKILLLTATSAAFVGQYAIAATVAGLGQPVATAIASVALPQTARTTSTAERRAIGRRAVRNCVLATTTVSLALTLVGPWLIPRVFGPSFSDSAHLLWVLLPGMGLRAVNIVMTALLRGVHQPSRAALSQVSAAAVFLLLILPLEMACGQVGVGLALVAAESAALAVAAMAWRRTG